MVSYSTRDRPVARRRRLDVRSLLVLLAFFAICAAVAAFGSITAVSGIDGWYSHVRHTTWMPPNWVFGAVWTVLYAAIAVAGWLIWRAGWRRNVRGALTLFVAQLVLNSFWTPVYFSGFQLIGPAALWIALVIIVALDLTVAATIVSFWRISRVAALILVPYLIWILFASSLNWGDAALLGLG